jgi:hypothetical protein
VSADSFSRYQPTHHHNFVLKVRINIVKGVGVVSALQRSGCWTSREVRWRPLHIPANQQTDDVVCHIQAVQISHLHATISRNYLELSLSRRLSPHTRPTPSDLRDLGFLHSSSTFAASLIQARAYDLERLRKKQEVKRMLEQGRIGRSLAEVMYGPAVADGTPRASSCSPSNRNVASLWDDASAAVVAALCPDIKQKKRFWEALAHEQALKTV